MATAYECMTLEQMIARMKHYHPNADASLVERAYAFAERVHGGQRRLSGEPYIIHPVYVASILTEIGIDAPTIAAGLLHDTVEDCKDVTLDVIRQEFGEEVAMLVDGVTKLSQLDFTDREERQAETLRKMILAMGRDIRVVLIKLADRLHNMRTLKFQPAPGGHRPRNAGYLRAAGTPPGRIHHQGRAGGSVAALYRSRGLSGCGAQGGHEARRARGKYQNRH